MEIDIREGIHKEVSSIRFSDVEEDHEACCIEVQGFMPILSDHGGDPAAYFRIEDIDNLIKALKKVKELKAE